jgi:hypothetical protein
MTTRRVLGTLLPLVMAGGVAADDVEPRRWTPLPVGTTVAGIAVIKGKGDISLDPVLQIEDGTVEQTTGVLSAVHAFDLLGKQARIDVRVPYQDARWEGLLAGLPRTRDDRGFADPRVRLSVNLLGPPALGADDFQAYRAAHPVETVVGAAVAATLPLGRYDDEKALNLGDNRYSITPQLGVVHNRGAWSYELTGSADFFTDNDEFLIGKTREQDPIYALQAHVVYGPSPIWWVAMGGAYAWGGESTVDGVAREDYRETLFFGASAGLAIDRQSSVQVTYVGTRAQTRIGSNTDNIGLGYSIRF